jgi:hypothetical protein
MKSKPFIFNIFRKSIVQHKPIPIKARRRRQTYAYRNCRCVILMVTLVTGVRLSNSSIMRFILRQNYPLLKNLNIYSVPCRGNP